VKLPEANLPDRATLAFPHTGGLVTRRIPGGRVTVQCVMSDIELPTGVPVTELWAVSVVTDLIVRLVELDTQPINEIVPKPLHTRGWLSVNPVTRPLDKLLVIVDTARIHVLLHIRLGSKLWLRLVHDLVDALKRVHIKPHSCPDF
jgi:hypothetical protein